VVGRAMGFANGRVEVDGAPALPADTLVVATGAGRDLAILAPELYRLTPIKGHILRAASVGGGGPVVRSPGVYLCRGGDELVLGATMELGLADTNTDAGVVAGLLARAEALAPGLSRLDWRAATGVRAATPDGLPMVGRSQAPGVVLAVGARRNGWLLAPLIAGAVLTTIEGGSPASPATPFEPKRFAATQPG
jgi:glycine oxidase